MTSHRDQFVRNSSRRDRASAGKSFATTAIAILMTVGFAMPAANAQEPVLLGVSTILSGPLSLLGQQSREGADLAAKEINAAGGVLGRNIEIRVADNACDPAQGINAVSNLVSEGVAAFIGSGCSSVTLGAMPIIDRENIVQLEYLGTNPNITKQAGVGGNQWQFRLNIDDEIMAKALSGLIADDGAKTVAIIARNDDYGRGAAAAFADELGSLGVEVISSDFLVTGTVDYRPTLTKIKGDNPDALLVIYDAPDAAPMAMQYTELGMTQKIYGRGTVVTPQFQALVKDPAIWNGAVEVNRWAANEGGAAFQEAYEEAYGYPPELNAALAYYGIHVLAEAVKAANSDDRTAVRDALTTIDLNFAGVGPVKFDDHHQAHPDMFVIQWDNGEIKTLGRRPTG